MSFVHDSQYSDEAAAPLRRCAAAPLRAGPLATLLVLPLTLLLWSLLLLLGLGSLLWNLLALPLYLLLPRMAGRRVGRAGIAYGYRLFWAIARACGMLRLEAGALDVLRDEPGLIIVANHPSLLDALMLVARLPHSMCIMKASLVRNIFLGAGARLARYVANDSPRRLIRRTVRDLQQGSQLVLFPEGTRTTQSPVNRFRPGVTLIAKLANAPIQTVFIDTDSPYLGKGWPLWRLPPLPIVFSVRLGKRFAPSADAPGQLRELEAYYTTALQRGAAARPVDGAPLSTRTAVVARPAPFPPAVPPLPAPTAPLPLLPPQPSTSHLVLIPSYNTGRLLLDTVRAARAQWAPVWVVIDGSTDGSAGPLQALAAQDAQLKVIVLPHNQGKGAAVLHGLQAAAAAGFSHALTMDADGQHPAAMIPGFMARSQQRPETMVLGRPVFDASAPLLRVRGRKVSNGWTNLETLGAGVADSLFGFRVYPIQHLAAVMARQPWMRRFDFDTEAVVRLAWRGVKPVNVDAPCKYPRPEDGGVSHFRYGRDNLLLTWMHTRLMTEFVLRLPVLAWRKLRRLPPFQA